MQSAYRFTFLPHRLTFLHILDQAIETNLKQISVVWRRYKVSCLHIEFYAFNKVNEISKQWLNRKHLRLWSQSYLDNPRGTGQANDEDDDLRTWFTIFESPYWEKSEWMDLIAFMAMLKILEESEVERKILSLYSPITYFLWKSNIINIPI